MIESCKERKVSTERNFEIRAVSKGTTMLCKLCALEGHTIGKYETYHNYEAKLAKIRKKSWNYPHVLDVFGQVTMNQNLTEKKAS